MKVPWSGHYPSFRQADLAIHACESIDSISAKSR